MYLFELQVLNSFIKRVSGSGLERGGRECAHFSAALSLVRFCRVLLVLRYARGCLNQALLVYVYFAALMCEMSLEKQILVHYNTDAYRSSTPIPVLCRTAVVIFCVSCDTRGPTAKKNMGKQHNNKPPGVLGTRQGAFCDRQPNRLRTNLPTPKHCFVLCGDECIG